VSVRHGLLGAILAAALALRLHHLGDGLWFDEIVTFVRYTPLGLREVVTTYDFQNQHFLYTLLAKAAIAIFGASAWALRLPAVLFGVASVGMLYLVVRDTLGAREALLSCGLMTFSYHHVWFSQNARGYIGLLFFTLLTGWLLLRALGRDRRSDWLAYAVAGAAGVYTHLTMVFVVLAHFPLWVAAAWWRRGSARPLGARGLPFGFVPAGLLSALLYLPVLPQMLGGTLREGGLVDEWKNPLWALLEFARGMRVGLANGVVALAALVVFALGCFALLRRRHGATLLALLFLPVGVTAVVALLKGHHLWPRLFFFAIGYGVVVAVSGALECGRIAGRTLGWPAGRGRLAGTALAVAMIAVSATTVPRAWGPKQDFGGALEYVRTHRGPGDAVVTVGLATFPYREYFSVDWRAVESVEELEQVIAGSRTTWLVYTLPFQLEAVHPELKRFIDERFTAVESFRGTLGGGAVSVCRADSPALARLGEAR